jgi:hypothetical protein
MQYYPKCGYFLVILNPMGIPVMLQTCCFSPGRLTHISILFHLTCMPEEFIVEKKGGGTCGKDRIPLRAHESEKPFEGCFSHAF